MAPFSAIVGVLFVAAMTCYALKAEPDSPAKAPRADAPPAAPGLADAWAGSARWVPDGDKLGADFGFHFPSIVPHQRELWAYYITHGTFADGRDKAGIGRARSTDGLAWTDDGPVLEPAPGAPTGDPPAWDDRIASFPGVWKDADTCQSRTATYSWPRRPPPVRCFSSLAARVNANGKASACTAATTSAPRLGGVRSAGRSHE